MTAVLWLIAFVILLGMEAATMALTTVWFAGGALIAFLLALLDVNVKVQLGAFVAVSFVMLIFTRPFAQKYLNQKTVRTNVDDLIGREAKVTTEINNRDGSGAALVNGQEWSARAVSDKEIIAVGSMVEIKEIRGVKLIVSEVKEGV